MQIGIRAKDFTLTDGLREHTLRRMQLALGWAHYHVNRISVRLSDDNGPRGGEDKRCRVRIEFDGAPQVLIEDTESDLYVAIDRAADRASRCVARHIERRRERRGVLRPSEIDN